MARDMIGLMEEQLEELKKLNHNNNDSYTDKARKYRHKHIMPSIGNQSLTQQLMGSATSIKNAFNKATLDVLPSIKKNIITPLTALWEPDNKKGLFGFIKKGLDIINSSMKTFFNETLVGKVLKSFGIIINGFVGVIDDVLGRVYKFATGILTESFEEFMSMQKASGNIAADIGLSKDQSKGLLYNFTKLTTTAIAYGGEIEDVYKIINEFSQTSGRNKVFSNEEVESIEKIGRGTALGVDGLARMVAEFGNLGISINSVFETTETARSSASKLGLNTKKVIESYKDLVVGLTGFQMRSGLDNMVKLATKAVELRMDLKGIAESMSEKFFEPESAIETAAKMNTLGGQFAEKFGDAFQLMYKAQMSPEDFGKDLMEMTKGLARKNEKGIFYIPPADMMMIREAAKNLGVNFDTLKNGAIEQAKLADKLGVLSNKGIVFKNEEDKEAIANLLEFNEKTGFTIRMPDGEMKLLDKLTSQSQFDAILQQKKADDDAAKSRQSFFDKLKIAWNRIQLSFSQVFANIFKSLDDSGFMKQLDSFVDTIVKTVIPYINNMFNDKGALKQTIDGLFNGLKSVMEHLNTILNGGGSVWDKIKDITVSAIKGIWYVVGPYIEAGFGKLLIAIGKATGFDTVTTWGQNMLLNVANSNPNNKNLQNITGSPEDKKMYEMNKIEHSTDLSIKQMGGVAAGGLLGGLGLGAVGGTLGIGAALASGAELGALGGSIVPGIGTLIGGIIGAAGGAAIAYFGEKTYNSLNNPKTVNKDDISKLYGSTSGNSNQNDNNKTEIIHSGTITVKSDDGKKLTVSDFENIGRYNIAQYLNSVNEGFKNGNSYQNNDKMPVSPISR